MVTHHIAAMLPPAWGHTVSYLQLAIQLLKADPSLVITIMQHNLMASRTEKELEKTTYDKTRLRILNTGDKDLRWGPANLKEMLEQLSIGWLETIRRLVEERDGWPKPHAIHFDFACGGPVIDETKKITGPNCKTLLWFCCAALSMIAHFTEYDFAAIAEEIYADETRRKDRTFQEILNEVVAAWNGTDELAGAVIRNPGAPDIYDYERLAYGAGPPHSMSQMLVPAQKLAKHVDGYIIASSETFEPVGVPYCREYYKKREQELFAVGMQTHESSYIDDARVEVTNKFVKTFLDDAARIHGPHSVLYISFGSIFFPATTPELVEALISTLLEIEKPFPFILALGGIMASLPKELVERVNASGRGLVCDFWVEQQAILQSGAVGWFLTHGGFNSVTECLTEGIPMIIWPVGAEQPINAAFLSTGTHPTAIELLQIRTGPQLAPSLRGGPPVTGTVEDASKEFKEAFAAARSARGETLRANAVKMKNALQEAHNGKEASEVLRLASF